MARFARDCLYKFGVLVKNLEAELGPETSNLGLRVGLHSGPVTAGVLRGDKARFQLFGDSMNTTARIETTGAKNRIHMSQDTADKLTATGKGHWAVPREDKVVAKGKGEHSTYWLNTSKKSAGSTHSGSGTNSSDDINSTKHSELDSTNNAVDQYETSLEEQHIRLVDWNSEVLEKALRAVVVNRKACGIKPDPEEAISSVEEKYAASTRVPIEEVAEEIAMSKFESSKEQDDSASNSMDIAVTEQLHQYTKTISAMYRDNPFHSYEHAIHVTMSAVKLLHRVAKPDAESDKRIISLDPLTEFAIIFSALIHDVDHTGVPNSQLIKEQASIAAVYKNRSIAEQNSVDIAWELLMQDGFKDLRRAIYATRSEFKQFRQTVINSVLATDVMDREISFARKARWNRAFIEEENTSNLKTAVFLEHLIQAADVAHTMQHWQVYRKWNTRLFKEMHMAYKEGRTPNNPADNWYEGEIAFFDFYVMPLAMKLQSSGAFGLYSCEFLNYAQQNRRQWESSGRAVVEEMIQSIEAGTLEDLSS